jgi:hypothetical protein
MWWLPLVMGGIGAIAGGFSVEQQRQRENEVLKKQKETAEKQYKYGKEQSDSIYAIQKGEAYWQYAMQERGVREGMNQFTDEYNTAMLSRAYGEQDARIQTAFGTGASLAAEGMSGTRGNAANQMVRNYSEKGMERQLEVQSKQDANVLAGTIMDANRTMIAIGHERSSWEEGGHRYETKAAQDKYNKDMYQLGQDNTDWQIRQNQPDKMWLDYLTGTFTGASSGMDLGYKYKDYFDQLDKNAWGNIGR